jgi:hypothetical protein
MDLLGSVLVYGTIQSLQDAEEDAHRHVRIRAKLLPSCLPFSSPLARLRYVAIS